MTPGEREETSVPPTTDSAAAPITAAGPGRHILRVRDVALIAPAYAIPGLASFATVPILFATLGAAEYGEWALLYAIAAGVPQVTTSWLEATVVRFGHRRGRASDRLRVVLAVLGSIACSALLVALVVPGSTWLELVSGAALTAVVSLYVLSIARLQSALAFGLVSVAASVRSVLGAALAVTGAMLSGDAAVAILGLATGYVLGSLLGRSLGETRPNGPDEPDDTGATAGLPAEKLSYGLASGVGAVSSYTLSVGDRIILSGMRPLAEVGTYAATYALVDLAGRFVPSTLLVAVRPRLFRAWDEGRRSDLEAAAIALAALVAWAVAGSTLILLGLGQLMPGLPLDAALVGPIAIGVASFVAATAVGLRYSAATRQTRLAGHLTVAALLNIGLNLALIPDHGAVGAAAATAASYLVLLLLNLAGIGLQVGRDRAAIATGSGTAVALAAICLLTVTQGAGWPLLLALCGITAVTPLVLQTGKRLLGSA